MVAKGDFLMSGEGFNSASNIIIGHVVEICDAEQLYVAFHLKCCDPCLISSSTVNVQLLHLQRRMERSRDLNSLSLMTKEMFMVLKIVSNFCHR